MFPLKYIVNIIVNILYYKQIYCKHFLGSALSSISSVGFSPNTKDLVLRISKRCDELLSTQEIATF